MHTTAAGEALSCLHFPGQPSDWHDNSLDAFVAVMSTLLSCLSRSNISSVVYYVVRFVLSRDSDDSVIFECFRVGLIQAGEFSTVNDAI